MNWKFDIHLKYSVDILLIWLNIEDESVEYNIYYNGTGYL